MNYYEITTKYRVPVEETDETKSVKKSYLVKAVSVTDAETSIINWAPSNYIDFEVESVKLVKYNNVIPNNDSENYFIIKVLNDDDGRMAKPVPFIGIYGGNDIESALERAKEDWSSSEIVSIAKYKPIVDLDLCEN